MDVRLWHMADLIRWTREVGKGSRSGLFDDLGRGTCHCKIKRLSQFRMLPSVTTFPHRMSASDPRLEVR